ncbi:MAG: arabinose efflux permease family protein [Acidimicrobiia bacterium]|nr:arabinose efflux permease family protein [Acidimicrobiia bacterium]
MSPAVSGRQGSSSADRLTDPRWRALTIGLVMAITLVAFESLAVATILPRVSRDLNGISLYGWVFSAFFLGNVVGIVLSGQLADQRGPVVPFAGGLALFAAGLLVAGTAPSMGILVLGRAVQGLGGGAIPAMAYVCISRTYPEALRPRMLAVLSSAFVVPGLTGPAISGFVAEQLGWRWVFIGLVPLVGLAAAIALKPLAGVGPPAESTRTRHLPDALRVAAGSGVLLGGLSAASWWATPLLIVVGAVVAVPALRRLLPSGALALQRGLPAAIALRGLVTFGFFGADAYVPLTVTDARGTHSTLLAGAALTAATLGWTAGSWVQERRHQQWGPQRFMGRGVALIIVGVTAMMVVAVTSVPAALAIPAWAVGGLGMGLAYSAISVVVLNSAPAGQEGATSAALQLSDNLGIALGAGAGGAAVALAKSMDWNPRVGVAAAFGLALVGALAAMAAVPRTAAAPSARP